MNRRRWEKAALLEFTGKAALLEVWGRVVGRSSGCRGDGGCWEESSGGSPGTAVGSADPARPHLHPPLHSTHILLLPHMGDVIYCHIFKAITGLEDVIYASTISWEYSLRPIEHHPLPILVYSPPRWSITKNRNSIISTLFTLSYFIFSTSHTK